MSQSLEGTSIVTVYFHLARNIDVAMQDVQNAVSAARRRLPIDIDPPVISKVNPNNLPVMWLTLSASTQPGGLKPPSAVKLALGRNFEFKLPLSWLLATPVSGDGYEAGTVSVPVARKLKLRFSLWQNGLPVDALPLEGWIELPLVSEGELMAMA